MGVDMGDFNEDMCSLLKETQGDKDAFVRGLETIVEQYTVEQPLSSKVLKTTIKSLAAFCSKIKDASTLPTLLLFTKILIHPKNLDSSANSLFSTVGTLLNKSVVQESIICGQSETSIQAREVLLDIVEELCQQQNSKHFENFRLKMFPFGLRACCKNSCVDKKLFADILSMLSGVQFSKYSKTLKLLKEKLPAFGEEVSKAPNYLEQGSLLQTFFNVASFAGTDREQQNLIDLLCKNIKENSDDENSIAETIMESLALESAYKKTRMCLNAFNQNPTNVHSILASRVCFPTYLEINSATYLDLGQDTISLLAADEPDITPLRTYADNACSETIMITFPYAQIETAKVNKISSTLTLSISAPIENIAFSVEDSNETNLGNQLEFTFDTPSLKQVMEVLKKKKTAMGTSGSPNLSSTPCSGRMSTVSSLDLVKEVEKKENLKNHLDSTMSDTIENYSQETPAEIRRKKKLIVTPIMKKPRQRVSEAKDQVRRRSKKRVAGKKTSPEAGNKKSSTEESDYNFEGGDSDEDREWEPELRKQRKSTRSKSEHAAKSTAKSKRGSESTARKEIKASFSEDQASLSPKDDSEDDFKDDNQKVEIQSLKDSDDSDSDENHAERDLVEKLEKNLRKKQRSQTKRRKISRKVFQSETKKRGASGRSSTKHRETFSLPQTPNLSSDTLGEATLEVQELRSRLSEAEKRADELRTKNLMEVAGTACSNMKFLIEKMQTVLDFNKDGDGQCSILSHAHQPLKSWFSDLIDLVGGFQKDQSKHCQQFKIVMKELHAANSVNYTKTAEKQVENMKSEVFGASTKIISTFLKKI